jgi:hypothetical protein
MSADPDEAAAAAARALAGRLVSYWQERLGAELLGAYLIGSLAHGGFSHRYSDIDLALVTEAGLSAPALEDARNTALALSPDWGGKVSIFWTDRRFSLGRFPPLDRIDLLDHAIVLTEREKVRPERPSLEQIREYLGAAPFAAWAERARGFAGAQSLTRKDHKAYLRALLYPGRLCYSWITGRMGSNDEAVAFLKEGPVAGLDIALIERALVCRRAAADPDALFGDRMALPRQIDACATLLAGD